MTAARVISDVKSHEPPALEGLGRTITSALVHQGSLECSIVEEINICQSRESNRSLLFQLEEAY